MTLNRQVFSAFLLSVIFGVSVARAEFEQVQDQSEMSASQDRRGMGHGGGGHGGHGGHHGGYHGGGWENNGDHGGGRGWEHGPGGNHGGGQSGGWGRPERPRQPLPPMPIPPSRPGNGGYNPYPGNGGAMQEQRLIQMRRRVINENIPLLYLAGIDSRYNGYIIQSVTVYMRGSAPGTQVSLIVNGQFEPGQYTTMGGFTLYPRYQAVIGPVRTMQLSVIGVADIDSISLNLIRGRF